MPFGYNGKILYVNLTTKKITVETPTQKFYRKYLGGSALGTYYCLRDIPINADPLGPDNVLALSPSVITGAPAPCLSRFSANAKSPLTGGIGDAQGGGWWAPELKFAGFDAVVVKGVSERPVYIFINNGKVEIKSAEHLWGMTTGEAEEAIRKENGDEKIRVAGIGLGGENLVKYACIINERKHSAGRTGMGAVMGSKKLKAIAVRGDKGNLDWYDKDRLKQISRLSGELMNKNQNMIGLKELGTNSGLVYQQAAGGLPTRNFSSGVFDKYENITAEKMRDTIFIKSERCYLCPVGCKRVVATNEPYEVDPNYGGPEYETVASLGSYLEIDDLRIIAKANELCNKHSIDTISIGSSIAFAMECYENGILTKRDTDGLDLRFGNKDVLIPMIQKIASREGIGNLLAEGPMYAAKKIGNGAEKYAMHVKGNPLPAHMPRVKRGLALVYAVNPFGADHVCTDQDPAYTPETPKVILDKMKGYGLYNPVSSLDLGDEKVKMIYYTQQYFSLMDSLSVCVYGYGTAFLFDLEYLTEVVKAVTGWNVTEWELMKTGERKTNMMRIFNAREGFTAEADILPQRLFEPLERGPSKGHKVDMEQFNRAKQIYYEMAGWDSCDGNPTAAKIKELDLNWIEGYDR